MILTHENNLEILQITLDCIKDKDKNDAFILVDNDTINLWLDHLEILERFEDCLLIKENKEYFIKLSEKPIHRP